MIEQKTALLAQYKNELAIATAKSELTAATITKFESEIEQIKKQIEQSPDLKA